MELVKLYAGHFLHIREVYDRALANHQFDQILIYSGEVKQRFQDDLPYPFLVNAQFKAVVPLSNAPHSWVVWRAVEKPLLLLYQPEDYWHAVPQVPDTYWTPYFEIKILKKKEDAEHHFGRTTHSAFLGETHREIENWEVGRHNPEGLIHELNWYRSDKTSYEQACIREANRTSVKGHIAARDAFYNGASELDIALTFQQACQQDETALAYPSIVGLNEHAGILHYWERDTISPDIHRSLLIDAGASCHGYASDITRSYAAHDGPYADMIIALDEVQQTLVESLTVGKRYFDCSLEALSLVAALLKRFDVLKLEPTFAVETGVVDKFMPHGLGHFLGLQVHDVGNLQSDPEGTPLARDPRYPYARLMRDIESNHIVTVEPGIYFIESLLRELYSSEHRRAVNWEAVEQLKPYGGIRIEDNVLITFDGPENITRQAFTYAMNDVSAP